MNLDLNNIDQLFEDSLEGMELTPSDNVKSQIKKAMFWHNAYKNNYVRISVVLLLIAIVGLIYFPNEDTKIQKPEIIINKTPQIVSENKVIDKTRITTNTKTIEKRKPEQKIINQSKKADNRINVKKEKQIFSFNNTKNKDSKLANRNTKATPIALTKKKPNLNTVSEKEVNNLIATAPLAKNSLNANTKVKEQSKKQRGILLTNEKPNTSVLEKSNMQEKSSDIEKRNSIARMPLKAYSAISNIEFPSLNGYPLLDDTVGIDIHGDKIILPSNRWTVCTYFRPNYSFTRLSDPNSELQSAYTQNKNAIFPEGSYGFGIDLSYQFKQLSVGGGLAYTQLSQQITTQENVLNIKNTNFWNYFDVENWDVQTTTYLNLDSLFQGDTVMTVITDSTKYITQDSSLVSRTDSTWTQKDFSSQNVYQYFEIPLFVEYLFNRSKTWQPFMRAGLVTGIYMKSKAYYLNANSEIIDASNLPFAKFNFWAHAGLGIKYNLNKKFSAYILGDYRYNLNAILKDEQYFNQNINNIGLSIGIQYHF